RWPSAKLVAGWISRAVRSGVGELPLRSTERSSSDHTGQRVPVVASTTVTGELWSRLRAMSMFVGGAVFANALGLSKPGTWVTIGEPGLKPSRRFQSVVSIGAPAAFRGVASGLTFSRRPVAELASGRVKKLFGHGNMQADGSIGSHTLAASCTGSAFALLTMTSRLETTSTRTAKNPQRRTDTRPPFGARFVRYARLGFLQGGPGYGPFDTVRSKVESTVAPTVAEREPVNVPVPVAFS